MIKKAYKIDENGFYTEDYIYEENQDLEKNIIVEDIPQGLYKPKWNKKEWIEGATQEYIDNISKPIVQESTETELLKQQLLETQDLVAELRYKTILKENGGM